MKRAAVELREFLTGTVGLEGGFLLIAMLTGAVGASYFHAAGPWLVVALVTFVVGVALAVPRAR